MGNNWVVVTDPNGHFIVLAIVAAAVVNGLVNVASQALKGDVHNLSQGFEYFGVGALAGAAFITGGPALAGGIQVVGNKAVQYLNGQWSPNDIHSAGDVANLALDVWTDYMTPELGANLGQALFKQAGWLTTLSGGGYPTETMSRAGWMEVGRSAPYEVVSTQLGSRAAQGAELAAADAMEGAAERGVSVIGPRAAYREFAQKIGANFLNVTDEAWTMRKNVEFLQGVVKRGDDVIFSGKFNPLKLDPNSVLGQEIRYLQRHGYSWTNDFLRLIKK